MSDSKHFDEIDENALGEVSGAGDDEQSKKTLENVFAKINRDSIFVVPHIDIEKILRKRWEPKTSPQDSSILGSMSKPPLDKDSKDKDKKENAGETGENKS